MVTTSKRVLVMDDEDVVCRSYERVLAQAGFEVGKAHSGAEALEEMRAHDYDVMLADLKMPGMDGLQVVEKLRETHPGMPVVVITGYPTPDTLQEAARLGVTDYLTKPVAPDVLTHATTQALSAPTWSGSAPYLANQGVAVAAAEIPFPLAIPAEPLLWPERPVAHRQPTVTEVAAPAEKAEPGTLRTIVHLALAPLISLAYVMFLPFVGFAVFFGLGVKTLYEKLTVKGA